MDRLEFYKNLRNKLQMIQDGYLELDHYAKEVDSKIEALSITDVGQSFGRCIDYETDDESGACPSQCDFCKKLPQ